MIKKITYGFCFIFLIFSCIQTPANLKNEQGEFVSRNGQINLRQDSNAQELFYISLKYLANDLGSEIIHSSRTKLSMKGKLPKGYTVSIQLKQKLDNVCEIRIFSAKHGRPDDDLTQQVATELLPKLR